MIRIDPLPSGSTAIACKFCDGRADVRLTLDNGRHTRLRWGICDACLETWQRVLEERRTVA